MLRLRRAVSRSVSGSGLLGRDAVCAALLLARFGVFDVLAAVLTGLPLAARAGCFDEATCVGFFAAAAAIVVFSARGGFDVAAARADLPEGGTTMGCAPFGRCSGCRCTGGSGCLGRWRRNG